MKKVLMFSVLLLILTSCSNKTPVSINENPYGGNSSTRSSTNEVLVEVSYEVGEDNDYIIEIKSYRITQNREFTTDYDIIVVTFEWTNNSGRPQSFDYAFDHFAFQNGIALSGHGIGGYDIYNPPAANESWREIQSGSSQMVRKVYNLNDMTSPVDIEAGTHYNRFTHTIYIDGSQPTTTPNNTPSNNNNNTTPNNTTDDSLVGTWEYTDWTTITWTFNADGTGISSIGTLNYDITWWTEGNTIYTWNPSMENNPNYTPTVLEGYRINGNTLTVTEYYLDDFGETTSNETVYTRMN